MSKKSRPTRRLLKAKCPEAYTYVPCKFSAGKDPGCRVWYIDYEIWDEVENRLRRVRYSKGFSKLLTSAAKTDYGLAKVREINTALEAGATYNKTIVKLAKQDKVPNMKNAWAEVIKVKQEEVGPSQLLRYHFMQDQWLKYTIELKEQPAINKVTIREINDFISWLSKRRERELNRPIAAKTTNEWLNTLSALFNHYVRMDVITKNPCSNVRRKPVEKGLQHIPFSLGQIAEIKAKAIEQGDHQFVLFMMFCLYTLARPGREIRLLKVKDLRESTIWIDRQYSKTKRSRTVDIPEPLAEYIKAQNIKAFNNDLYVFGMNGTPGPKPIGENKMYLKFRQIMEALKMTDKEYTLYGFKHTGACQYYLNGVDLVDIQNLCGHSTIKMTENYLINLGVLRKSADIMTKAPRF